MNLRMKKTSMQSEVQFTVMWFGKTKHYCKLCKKGFCLSRHTDHFELWHSKISGIFMRGRNIICKQLQDWYVHVVKLQTGRTIS